MISESAVQKAMDILVQGADKAAKARAEVIYAEQYRKSLKAILMADNADLPLGAQEREAYRHPRYLEHLEKLKAAVLEDEKCKAERMGASALIDAWRTSEASRRGADRV